MTNDVTRLPEARPARVRIEVSVNGEAGQPVVIQVYPVLDSDRAPGSGAGAERKRRLSWWAKLLLRIAAALAFAALGAT